MKSAFGPVPDKKVPASKKYAHVQSSINTGASASKQQVVSDNVSAKRRDEIFKRIRAATLVRLLQERNVCESIFSLGEQEDAPVDTRSAVSVAASRAPTSSASLSAKPHLSQLGKQLVGKPQAPSVASAAMSVAGSVVSIVDADARMDESQDMILLDLRDAEEFERCHLPLAASYPAAKVNRDQVSPELYKCKRDPSKLLVVYHTNDATTAGVATLLVQKGWESVYALSGGFDEMVQSYPEVLEGEVPERPRTGATDRSTATTRSTRTASTRSITRSSSNR